MLEHQKGYSVAGNYGISSVMSLLVTVGAIIYKHTENEWVDLCTYLAMIIFWIMPLPWKLYQTERSTAISTFLSSFGTKIGLAEVVLCDLLTSYSRIILLTVLESVWLVKILNNYL